jgi:predicted nucleotidyltransferase
MAPRSRAAVGSRRMHQTTLRFAPELWSALSYEAELAGVSVAQYVREAVLTRIVYAAGRRGDSMIDSAMSILGIQDGPHPHESVQHAQHAVDGSQRQLEGAAAVWAQSRQARARARELRDSVHEAEAARRREAKKS